MFFYYSLLILYLPAQRANKYLTIYLDEKALIIPSICWLLWCKYPTNFRLRVSSCWTRSCEEMLTIRSWDLAPAEFLHKLDGKSNVFHRCFWLHCGVLGSRSSGSRKHKWTQLAHWNEQLLPGHHACTELLLLSEKGNQIQEQVHHEQQPSLSSKPASWCLTEYGKAVRAIHLSEPWLSDHEKGYSIPYLNCLSGEQHKRLSILKYYINNNMLR